MPADWKAELEEMKKATEEEIKESRRKEEELREKYKGDKERIIDLINSQLKPVVETFKEEDMEETSQPKIKKYHNGISLNVPIVQEVGYISFSISFDLVFTDRGYEVKTRKSGYDHVQDRAFTSEAFIHAPVDIKGIRDEIRAFLRDRNFAIKMLEEKKKRLQRK